MIQPAFDLFGDQTQARSNYIRQVQRTVETYDIELKVVLELLQNAIDAAVRAGSTSVWVDIDLPAKRVTVTDEGPGFPPNRDLLFLGGTDKEDDLDQKGKIGVGLKAVLFSSRRFQIHSVSAAGVWDVDVGDADATLQRAHEDPNTELRVADRLDPDARGDKSGTTVTVEFRGREVHEWVEGAYEAVFTVAELAERVNAADLLFEHGEPFATRADAFLHLYFRTAPYAADVRRLLSGESGITINIHLKVGKASEQFPDAPAVAQMLAATEYTHSVQALYCDFEQLLRGVPPEKVKSSLVTQPMPPGGDPGVRMPNRVWILRLRTKDEVESLIRNVAGAVADGHEQAIERINAVYLVLGDPVALRSFIPGGAKRLISAQGIITAHAFSTPRGARHELYIPRIHMIVDVDADLNYGKRHLNDRRLVKYLQQFFAEAYTRTLFQATKGLSAAVRRPRDATDRSYVGLADLGLPIPIKKVPEVEQDVVALYCALLGAGLLKGYDVYGLSQVEQYDGRFYARRRSHKGDPLFTTDDNLYKLEFKHKISQLCADFENDEKDPTMIDLAIVWENDAVSDRWRMLELEAKTAVMSDGRDFPEINRILWDTKESHEVQVVVLEEVVQSLREGGTS